MCQGYTRFPGPSSEKNRHEGPKVCTEPVDGSISVTVRRYTQLSRSCLDKYFYNWPRLQWSGTLREDTKMLIEIAWSGLDKHVGKCTLLKKRSCVTFLMGLSVMLHNALITFE